MPLGSVYKSMICERTAAEKHHFGLQLVSKGINYCNKTKKALLNNEMKLFGSSYNV